MASVYVVLYIYGLKIKVNPRNITYFYDYHGGFLSPPRYRCYVMRDSERASERRAKEDPFRLFLV